MPHEVHFILSNKNSQLEKSHPETLINSSGFLESKEPFSGNPEGHGGKNEPENCQAEFKILATILNHIYFTVAPMSTGYVESDYDVFLFFGRLPRFKVVTHFYR